MTSRPSRIVCIVTAHDAADRLPATLAALAETFPGARVVVADDGSTDDTAAVARAAGAEVVGGPAVGKGGAATRAGQRLVPLALDDEPPVFVLCDGDLGEGAAALAPLAEAVRRGEADLAIGAAGPGVGAVAGLARRVIRRLTGLTLRAPVSGERALSGPLLPVVVPFAPRSGMEVGMTVDAARAGFRVTELGLGSRPPRRSRLGPVARGRALADVVAVLVSRF